MMGRGESILPVVRAASLNDADDCAAIDAFVTARHDGTPFHLTAWVKAIETGCEHKAHILLATDAKGAILGMLPLHAVISPLFGNALVSSGFAVSGGVLADDSAIADQLLAAAWAMAERANCPRFEVRGGPITGDGWHIDRSSYASFIRPLSADQASELRCVTRKQRAEIRKALDNALDIEIGNDKRDRAAHYAVYAESVRNLGTPVFPRSLFDAVLDGFGENADILTVRAGGRPIASVLSLYFNGTVYPYWGGGTREARRLRANDLMYFTLMGHAREKGCTRFDFGRSKCGTGAYAFKKNWGFTPTPLQYAVRLADGAAPRSVNPLDPRYRLKIALWQRLPLWVANRIGPMIARGLA